MKKVDSTHFRNSCYNVSYNKILNKITYDVKSKVSFFMHDLTDMFSITNTLKPFINWNAKYELRKAFGLNQKKK